MSAVVHLSDLSQTSTNVRFPGGTPNALGSAMVISGHSDQCPLYPQKRTLVKQVGMSALCQMRTSGVDCYMQKNPGRTHSGHGARSVRCQTGRGASALHRSGAGLFDQPPRFDKFLRPHARRQFVR